MKVKDLAMLCLGGDENSVSIEKPIDPSKPNEVIYQSNCFNCGLMPSEINEMEFTYFSIGQKNTKLAADIIIYVDC